MIDGATRPTTPCITALLVCLGLSANAHGAAGVADAKRFRRTAVVPLDLGAHRGPETHVARSLKIQVARRVTNRLSWKVRAKLVSEESISRYVDLGKVTLAESGRIVSVDFAHWAKAKAPGNRTKVSVDGRLAECTEGVPREDRAFTSNLGLVAIQMLPEFLHKIGVRLDSNQLQSVNGAYSLYEALLASTGDQVEPPTAIQSIRAGLADRRPTEESGRGPLRVVVDNE